MRVLPRFAPLTVAVLLAGLAIPSIAGGQGRKAPAQKARAAAPPKLEMEPELRQRVDETLAEALAGRDALAQGTALAAQVDLGDAAAGQRVEEALAEDNWGIKRFALLITGREARPAFFPAMAKVLENTTSRPLGFDLLDMLPAPVRVKVLQQAIVATEQSLRQEVIQRMLGRGDEEAISVLEAAVAAPDPALRGEVFAGLPRLTSAAGVRYLMKLSGSPDAEVRRHAQDAMLQSKDPQVKPFLLQVLGKSKDLRIRVEAARALAAKGTRNEVLPVLRAALDERDTELRVLAMEGIAALGDRVIAAELRPLAVNPREDKAISTAALKVLGGTGDIANLETLRQALSMDYIHLRVAAVEAMGALGRAEAVPDLGGALRDGHELVRAAAATALGRIGGREIVPHLRDAVEREENPEVVQRIIEAMGRSGVEDGVMALQVLLVHPDPKVKAAAVNAMLEIGDPKTANTLLVVVDPREPEVMEAAIRAICLLDPKLGMIALKPNLRHVSLQLLHDLHNEGGPRATSFLEQFLVEGTQKQRSLALDLLLHRGAEGLQLVRQAAVANADSAIRRAALRSLLVREDSEALDVFVRGLEDSDDGIRGICVESLGLLGSAEHQQTLVKMLEDRAPSVRAAAAHGLIRLASQPAAPKK